ncbi:2-aminobenzoate-CoA ligase, partial [Streptomyces virginiae]
MDLKPSAHTDTFARDHLPPADTWPELVFELPELAYPDRLNCGVELLDATIARFGPAGADRPAFRSSTGEVSRPVDCRHHHDTLLEGPSGRGRGNHRTAGST